MKKIGLMLGSMAVVALVLAGGYSYACDGSACSSKKASKAANKSATEQTAVNATLNSTGSTAACAASCDASKASAQKASGTCDVTKCVTSTSNAAMTSGASCCTVPLQPTLQ